MMRFCPNCHSERSLHEFYCEGVVDDRPCQWDLSNESIHESGWRPQEVVTQEDMRSARLPAQTRCVNGHDLDEGDLMCPACGSDVAPRQSASALGAAGGTGETKEPGVFQPTEETQIGGWRLMRQLVSSDSAREQYVARDCNSDRQAILTLYRPGAEPDPSIYEVVRRLPRDHVQEIYATGRWDGRAYEVAEELSGETLADIGIVLTDMATIQCAVKELGEALHAFSEAGLRHRDLRPDTLLVRRRAPLDLVISGFGSARLSDFDLDIVSPLEMSQYMAPEAIAGGVAAASDWWSLGMVLLEQITQGACFQGVNSHAFIIHTLSNGVSLPDNLDPALHLLLRGLLVRNRHERWQWPEVKAWLAGEPVSAPAASVAEHDSPQGASISLAKTGYHKPTVFALAAAEAGHWAEARDHLQRGVLVTWAEHAGVPAKVLAGMRQAARLEGIDDDARLMLVLKLLNPEMPLILRGDIVTPGWLLSHPLEAYDLITGPVPPFLERLEAETWLSRLRTRADQVRERARGHHIDLDEDSVRVNLLSTSRARLWALWEERRVLLPDSDHVGLLSLSERRSISEEDLIVLLSAAISQFRSADSILQQASTLAQEADIHAFDVVAARQDLALPRMDLYRKIDDRIAGFARTGHPTIDGWAERFRLTRRLPLHQAIVLLAVPAEQWLEPQKQQYVYQILDFFEKKIATAVLRGPLVRMTIGKTTARIDVSELGSNRHPGSAILDHLLQRNSQVVALDPAVFLEQGTLEARLHSLYRQTSLYKRDTGIDGLYLGFPFLLYRDARAGTRTRIAPVLLWPIKLLMELGARGQVSLAFDSEREDVRLNPALEGLLGRESARAWREAADEVLGRSALRAADVMDAFGMLAAPRGRTLASLPSPTVDVPAQQCELSCAAVLFHVTFIGQAIGEDVRRLKDLSPVGSALETMLRLQEKRESGPIAAPLPEIDRYLTVASDPSQEAAVLQARQSPGLLVEGPPGTGKSQTIVNMVADAIGRGKSLLIVCQKHAALEVVYKRLVAEGLEKRSVMVNDVNKDREPIIRAVREQLEALLRAPGFEAGWVQQRERMAARIEALEGALDRQHQALHQVDAQSGLSYRALLGELMRLEAGRPPIDMPQLRSKLAALDVAALTMIEEQCAPLGRYWLPSRYEGSPLAQLQPFATDPATMGEFRDAFSALREAERLRLETLAAHPARFEIDDPEPYRAWLNRHAPQLIALDDTQRRHLAGWLPLFRPAERADAPGHAHYRELERIHVALGQCPATAYMQGLSPALAKLAAAELAALEARLALATRAPTLLSKLNPITYIRRRKLLKFIASHGERASIEILPALLEAVRLEQKWRPLRQALGEVSQLLKLPPIDETCGPALAEQCLSRLRALEEIRELAHYLGEAPRGDEFDAAALKGERAHLAKLLSDFENAFIRNHARTHSAERLRALADWFSPVLTETCVTAIRENGSCQAVLNGIHEALPQLAAYQLFRARARQLSAAAMETFAIMRQYQTALAAVRPEELDREIRRTINREARLGWKRRLEHERPDLLLEDSDRQAKIAALADADEQMRKLNRNVLREGIDRGRLRTLRDWEDVTRLSGRRARRLREFIELGAPLGLMTLRPVWLMNPDVASRLLPLKPGLFDAVIYDEASQMPVEFAIPTLFRGRVAVVSGDEKQMPPTSFFSSRADSDEADLFDGEMPDEDATEEERDLFEDSWNRREIKDCPDLLQLARTTLPAATLQIHYRSAYRELIGYSNAAFYDNQLSVPARHPEHTIRQVKPLELIQVNGLYQQQTNEAEAARVVALLAELWSTPGSARPSVGVVTFNRKQADLIEERLAQRAEEDISFRNVYREESNRVEGGEDMAVFVKNVENVQGDERDVIIFSTTFGKNAQGVFRRIFGVLGQKGGERRLNVAITRARHKVILVTSMPIADVSDMLGTRRRPATPRDHLQGYLEYARAMSHGELPASRALLSRMVSARLPRVEEHNCENDGFAEAVLTYIQSLGLPVVPAREGDAFGIDFAIPHPETGLYAIGIECDAPRHALLLRARAREIWRRSVLQRAIPHLHRVSSQEWYRNGEEERARLKAAIDAALRVQESKAEVVA